MEELRSDYEAVEKEIKEAKFAKRTRILDDYRNNRDWHQDSQFEGPIEEMNAVQKVKTKDYCTEYESKQKPVFDEITELDELLKKFKPQPIRFPLGKRSLIESLRKSGSKSSRRESRKSRADNMRISMSHYAKSPERFGTITKSHVYTSAGGLGLK